jgi:hypothetical protein
VHHASCATAGGFDSLLTPRGSVSAPEDSCDEDSCEEDSCDVDCFDEEGEKAEGVAPPAPAE